MHVYGPLNNILRQLMVFSSAPKSVPHPKLLSNCK